MLAWKAIAAVAGMPARNQRSATPLSISLSRFASAKRPPVSRDSRTSDNPSRSTNISGTPTRIAIPATAAVRARGWRQVVARAASQRIASRTEAARAPIASAK